MAQNLLQNASDLQNTTPVSGTPALVNGSGEVLVQRQTASGSSLLPFTNLGSYPYTTYKLYSSNVVLAGTALYSFVALQLSTDNGNTYSSSGYKSQNGQVNYGATSWNLGNTAAQGLIIGGVYQASTLISSVITLFNINSTTSYCSAFGLGVSAEGSSAPNFDLYSGTYGSIVLVNAFAIFPQHGTFSGTFSLYGLS
jgi:hypothetical protein